MKRISLVLCLILLGYTEIVWGQECKFTVSPLKFGNYSTFSGAPRNGTGKIIVTCDRGIPFTVKLGKGKIPTTGTGSGFNQRRLEASGVKKSLRFNLYRDSAYQEIWGDGTGNTFVVTGTGTGKPVYLTVYGRIPARQNVPAEFYSNLINVIVEW